MASEEDEVRALLMRHRKQIIRDFNESKLITVLTQKGVLNVSNERLFNEIQCETDNLHKSSIDPITLPIMEHLTNGPTTNGVGGDNVIGNSESITNEINEKKCSFLIKVISKNGFEKFKEFCYAIESECPQLIEDLINDRLKGGKLEISRYI